MKKNKTSEVKGKKCLCPYCEEEVAVTLPLHCKPCGVTLRYCVKCKVVVAREAEVCPGCGGELQWK